ncbi:MAG: hypothetical protein WBK55_08800 [Alphaproteobacteria bacterium]
MTRTVFLACFLFVLASYANIAAAAYAPAPTEVEEQAAPPVDAEKAQEKTEEKQQEKKEEKKEEAPKQENAVKEELPPEAEAHKKAAEESFRLTKEVAEKLGPDEQKHFFILYNNYNLISTVKMVKGDVAAAVTACGKENPDMKEGLDARLTEWSGAIDPAVKDADANIENMIIAQEYAKSADIKKVFKSLDKTRKLANAQVEKVPVTTKDACEYLRDKMSDTQTNFVRLLQSTLMSAPQIAPMEPRPAAAEEKKEEPAAQAEEKVEEKAEEKKPEEKAEEIPAEDPKPEERAPGSRPE